MTRPIKHFDLLQIQLEPIKSATKDFSEENCIGKGGFGSVYKGELANSMGQTSMVAIKRLKGGYGQGEREFLKEIHTLSLYRNENIVSLLGFCDESNEKILVYEYVSRRSLDLYLNSDNLTWVRRLKICIGAARGLAYLHCPNDTHQRLVHRDIKSGNILLDEDWNARISDFGLSKFVPANQLYTIVFSNPAGTLGYVDPLCIQKLLLTKESDVYSLGVVLFEVLCGRLCFPNGTHKQPLIELVQKYYDQNKIKEIVFDKIKDEINPSSLKIFTTIAYRCLNLTREARPPVNDVASMLETALYYQEHIPSTPISLRELNGKQFAGYIPLELGKLADLFDLNVAGNKLEGHVPENLSSGTNLNSVLKGTILAAFQRLDSMTYLNLSSNYLIGPNPIELSRIGNLDTLDLSNNKISGLIPSPLGDLEHILKLNMSMNGLTEYLPTEFGNLRSVMEIDLSYNNLSGILPQEIGQLQNLFMLVDNMRSLELSFTKVNSHLKERLDSLCKHLKFEICYL